MKLSKRIRKSRAARRFAAFAVLVPALAGAYVAAFLLRFDGSLPAEQSQGLLWTLPWAVGAKVAAAYWFRIHQGWTRYVTFHDLGAIAKAMTCGVAGAVIIDALFFAEFSIPRSVVFLDWGASIGAVGALRAAPRMWRGLVQQLSTGEQTTSAIIVGADDAGETLLRTVTQNRKLHYQIVGFVDDRRRLSGQRIAGVPVLGTLADLKQLAEVHEVDEVLIHSGDLPGRVVRNLVETAGQCSFRVKVLPSFEQLLDGQVSIQPRSVAIEDLLRRDSVELDNTSIRDWLGGRTVLVTGAAGSIGSEICRQLLALNPARLLVVDRSETGQFFLQRELQRLAPQHAIEVVIADLTDRDRMRTVFAQHKPEIVFHAAAYKHVPLMEDHPGEAIKNIVLATRNIVDLAEEYDVRSLVMISTDKAVNPTSIMGSCKQLAERYVQAKAQASNCQFVTVRFGNVLDSAGSVVPVFREQIERGGPVTVTHPDIIRYFMMIPEAAQLVIQAGAMGQGGEIFVLDMGEPVKITDLARDMIRLSGLREGEDIDIEFTGLRPGEKLFEELYGDQENHRPTAHSKIMVADSQAESLLEIFHAIANLELMVNQPVSEVRDSLGDVVPLYQEPPTIRRVA